MSKRPMERTREWLKQRGIMNGIVERYFPPSKKYPFGCKEDLFHIIDLIALENGITGYQVCGTDWMPHVRKMTKEHRASTVAWLSEPGARLILIGWRKVAYKRGGKLKVWKPRIAEFFLRDGQIVIEDV